MDTGAQHQRRVGTRVKIQDRLPSSQTRGDDPGPTGRPGPPHPTLQIPRPQVPSLQVQVLPLHALVAACCHPPRPPPSPELDAVSKKLDPETSRV